MILNDILNAITRRLDELYPTYAIYTNDVEQGLQEPCFFVQVLEPSRKPVLGGRSFQQNGFCIQCFPGEIPQKSETLNDVAESLMNEMEYVTLKDGSLLRGSGRSYRILEGVLSFFISYNLFLVQPKEKEEIMEEITVNTEVRDEYKETRK